MLKDTLAPTPEGPIVLVIGTHNVFKQVVTWIKYARRAGCRHYRIVCMDDEIELRLREQGEKNTLSYYELFPDAVQISFRSGMTRDELFAERNILWKLRIRLCAYLAEQRVEFIFSDADALWIKDPRPFLILHPEYDLLISQGIYTHNGLEPHKGGGMGKNHDAARFPVVLCAGFFLARPSLNMQNYFKEVALLIEEYPNDQYCMNEILMRNSVKHRDIQKPMRIPIYDRKKSAGWAVFARLLSIPMLQPFSQRLLRLLPRHCIVVSPEIIRWVSGELTVGVIPMGLIARKNRNAMWHWSRLIPKTKAMVIHSYTHK